MHQTSILTTILGTGLLTKFGDANAIDQLHNLADKAMANGHTVEWFNNPDGTAWLKVDGSSATADVLKVLNKYA